MQPVQLDPYDPVDVKFERSPSRQTVWIASRLLTNSAATQAVFRGRFQMQLTIKKSLEVEFFKLSVHD